MYGVVTEYTAAPKTSGFNSGLLVNALNVSLQAIEAVNWFTKYDIDLKANFIRLWLNLLLPDLNLHLDEALIIFAVYSGLNVGDTFKNFSDIPDVLDTRAACSYRTSASS